MFSEMHSGLSSLTLDNNGLVMWFLIECTGGCCAGFFRCFWDCPQIHGVGFWYNWKPWNVLFKDKQNEIFLYDASENLDTGELSNVQDHNICLIECK